MTKALMVSIIVLLMIGSGLGVAFYSTWQQLSKTEQIVLQQISTINQQSETIQSDTDTIRSQRDTIQSQRDTIQNQNDTIQSQTLSITTLTSDLVASQTLLASTKASLESTKRYLADIQTDIEIVRSTLETTESTLQQYQDTWGSVVASGIPRPHWWNFNDSSIFTSSLSNNSSAKDITFAQLQDFLRKDQTDQKYYVEGEYTAYTYMCGDFAKDLHNNAEQAGIRSAWVAIDLAPSMDNPLGTDHSVTAFKTTDKGLVFIDDTGYPDGEKPLRIDRQAMVKKGENLKETFMFPESGWIYPSINMGEILDVEVYW